MRNSHILSCLYLTPTILYFFLLLLPTPNTVDISQSCAPVLSWIAWYTDLNLSSLPPVRCNSIFDRVDADETKLFIATCCHLKSRVTQHIYHSLLREVSDCLCVMIWSRDWNCFHVCVSFNSLVQNTKPPWWKDNYWDVFVRERRMSHQWDVAFITVKHSFLPRSATGWTSCCVLNFFPTVLFPWVGEWKK